MPRGVSHIPAGMLKCMCVQVYQEEFGTVRGHFGPVNAAVFHPDGRR